MNCLIRALSLLSILSLSTPELGKSETLPVPTELNADVYFWEQIFSRYQPSQCVFHDSKNLNVIFQVRKIPEGSSIAKRRFMKRAQGEIEHALSRLGSQGRARTAVEKAVFAAVPKSMRSPSYFRGAKHRVRCQRGVDISSSIQRSKTHLPMIKKIFASKRLPEDLAYLPHLESGFNSTARSKAGAVGLWQFMPGTARQLGLAVSKQRDYRKNPYLSTVYAAKHFQRLMRQAQNWPLAITAYNYGENGVRRAIKKYGPDYLKIRKRHKTRIFGFAAKNYYPSFIAARNVADAASVDSTYKKSGLLFNGHATVKKSGQGQL